MEYIYCQNSACGAYLGSLGASRCVLCGWQAPTETYCYCEEHSDVAVQSDVQELVEALKKVEGQADDRVYNIVRPVLSKWEGKE